MEITFHTDSTSGLPHFYKHGVTEDEVEDVMLGRGEDLKGRDGTRVARGQTSAGKYLRVVYVPRPGGAFVLTAIEMQGNDLRAFRRRRRRRQ